MSLSNIIYIFQLQLDRIKSNPSPHASGPKKPSLSEVEGKGRK
jgi:hypothetical protein